MTVHTTAANIFKARFNKAHLNQIFNLYIAMGSSTGRDGVKLDVFKARLNEEIDIIIRKVNACNFEFTSYKEKLISKGASKPPRQLSIPTIRDKLVLKFLAQLLVAIYPDQAAQTPHLIIKRVHELSGSRPTTDYYLRLDIQNFYPSIDHKILMRILRRKIRSKQILHLIENAIKTPTGKPKTADNQNQTGVPQGLSISNILASIYLTDIDADLTKDTSIDYFRFVDDILIIANKAKVDELEKSVSALLKRKRKIKCHPVGESSKSLKIILNKGIEYLGYRFCIDKIEVRPSSFKKMFANLMKILTGLKYKKSKGRLIWRLNLRISGCQYKERHIGWLFFFSQSKNIRQLKQLDAFALKQAEKFLSDQELKTLKRFVKAHYEIKYHASDTKYFPNFDNFDDDQKKAQITILQSQTNAAVLDALSPEELDVLFKKCIGREIADLEIDMMEVFS